MPAHIKKWCPPQCPVMATIPLVEVATKDDIKKLCNCFVHITSTNQTFYIDSQHRFIICWSGMVFQDDYDASANPLGIRGQIVGDLKNNRIIVYNDSGEGLIITGTPVSN